MVGHDVGVSAEFSGDVGGQSHMRVVARAKTRPINDADLAQARVFEEILQQELAELEQLVAAAAARRANRIHRDGAALQPSDELVRLRGRLTEVQRLLGALRHRFL